MQQNRIKVFLAVARTQSISSAARALNFTQPTVSEALNQLEKEMGTRLVVRERGAHRVYLTPAGEEFLPIARRWLEADEQAEYYKKTRKKKILRLAAGANGHEFVAGYVIQKLKKRNSDLIVRLSNVEGNDIINAIYNNSFDVALFYGMPFTRPHFEAVELFCEERYVICPSDTNLPDRPLLLSDLDPQHEIRHSVLEKNPFFAKWRSKAFPFYTGPVVEVDALTAIPSYLDTPDSWALMPISIARAKVDGSEGKLTYRRLQTPPPNRSLWALIMNDTDAGIVQDFLECCGEYMDERPYLMRSPDFRVSL